jgi:hypothetical protein
VISSSLAFQTLARPEVLSFVFQILNEGVDNGSPNWCISELILLTDLEHLVLILISLEDLGDLLVLPLLLLLSVFFDQVHFRLHEVAFFAERHLLLFALIEVVVDLFKLDVSSLTDLPAELVLVELVSII